jgi:YlmC/YmxH family sporulation protein
MLFKISDFGLRDTVNILDGSKMGPVKDVQIDPETGQVHALIITEGRRYLGLFSFGQDLEVPWEKIKKIGVDTILIEM